MAAEREPEYIEYREPSDELGALWLHLPRLRRLLSELGLHLVTAAELEVVKAMAEAEDADLKCLAEHGDCKLCVACSAELARRGEKKQ